MPPLWQLPEGTRFRVPGSGLTGTLLKSVYPSRCRVQLDSQLVTLTTSNGERCSFERSRYADWACSVAVIPISTPEEMQIMATTKKSAAKHQTNGVATKPKKASAQKSKAITKAAKTKKTDGKLSAIDAAAKVLAESKEPLTTKEMIERMAAKGYWTSPGGQTPAATLYSAILREIQKQGKQARFSKTERGKFALNIAAKN